MVAEALLAFGELAPSGIKFHRQGAKFKQRRIESTRKLDRAESNLAVGRMGKQPGIYCTIRPIPR